jgi:hypothetical protein
MVTMFLAFASGGLAVAFGNGQDQKNFPSKFLQSGFWNLRTYVLHKMQKSRRLRSMCYYNRSQSKTRSKDFRYL